MKKTYKINLKYINSIKKFVNLASNIKANMNIRTGTTTIDAKSLMGLFSINLSDDVNVEVDTTELPVSESEAEIKKFEENFKEFIVC